MAPRRSYFLVNHSSQSYLRHFVRAYPCTWRDLSFDLGNLGKTIAFSLEPVAPKGAIFFAHGTGNDGVFPQLQLFRDFLARGWAVYSFDLPGHGLGSTTLLDSQSAVQVVRHALQIACAHYQGLEIYAVGYSLGGALLARAVLGAPALAGVRYLATPTSLRHLGIRAAVGELPAIWQKEFYQQAAFYGPLGIIPPLGFYRRQSFPIRISAVGPAKHYISHVAEVVDQMAVLDAVKESSVPSLFVYGQNDFVVPLSQGQALALACPQAQLIVLPGLTHYTLLFGTHLVDILIGPC
jgi:pimeloyl-ACP methyl ester carboxylesterase